ncbi:MAG: serine hydrolase domain-containing protein [Pseudomonadota bacterium]
MLGPDVARYVDAAIDYAIENNRLIGAVVLVAIDGEIVYQRAAGMADREARSPMRENAIFRLASVTKPMVSATALSLVEEGLLSLTGPVTRWLPTFKPKTIDGQTPEITLRHLLTHTAGLDYGFDDQRPAYRTASVSTGLEQPGLASSEAIARLSAMPLVFKPGTNWLYSLAIDVVGAIIERASGASLAEVVKQKITAPLDMKDTGFSVTDAARLVTAYRDALPHPKLISDGDVVNNWLGPITFSPSRVFDASSYQSGGAGMVGTVADFLRFLEAIRTGGHPILGDEGHRLIMKPALPSGVSVGEAGWDHGMAGLVLKDNSRARGFHGNGTWRGGGAYGHHWFVDPKSQLSFVCFTNTAFEGCDGPAALNIRDALYRGLSETLGERTLEPQSIDKKREGKPNEKSQQNKWLKPKSARMQLEN